LNVRYSPVFAGYAASAGSVVQPSRGIAIERLPDRSTRVTKRSRNPQTSYQGDRDGQARITGVSIGKGVRPVATMQRIGDSDLDHVGRSTETSLVRLAASALLVAGLPFALASPSDAQTVILKPSSEGISAEYRLDRPVARVTFADQGIVRTDWLAASPGVALEPGSVTNRTPVKRFTLTVRPDSTEDERGYIALTRLGDGYVLYGPGLRSEGSKLFLKFRLPAGWTAQPRALANGYLYIGPKANVAAGYGDALHVAVPRPASPLTTAVLGAFDKALAFFTGYFGHLPERPIMSVTHAGAGPMLFRGDVTDSGMISVRLHQADSSGADTLALATRVAFHETSHLWNSHLARPAEGSPWLHEGGAEYLALVGLASTGGISQAEALAALSQRLSDCRTALGERVNAAERISEGPAVYDCGTVIQWLTDMEMRRRPDTSAGVVHLWADLVSRARKGQPEYGPSDFLAIAGRSSAASIFFNGAPETRWAMIDAVLATAGVSWRSSPSSESLMVAALRHLNAQACPKGASSGMSWRDSHVELGNDPACGPLAGDVPLASIQGHDVLNDTAAMFKAVQEICAKRQTITIRRRGSSAAIGVPCRASLTAPVAYQLVSAPLIAVPQTHSPTG